MMTNNTIDPITKILIYEAPARNPNFLNKHNGAVNKVIGTMVKK